MQEGALNSDDPDDRQHRMAELVPHVKPPPGSAAEQHQNALFNKLWKSPKHRKAVKEMHERAMATLLAQQQSGDRKSVV